MVGRSDHNDVTGKLVQLHQQERDDALDFAGFVGIAAFLADRIELVEEQNARPCADIVEELTQARIRFAQIASDQGIVSDDEKRQPERLRHRLSE